MAKVKDFPTVPLQKILYRISNVPKLSPINHMTIVQFANNCGYSYPGNGAAQAFLSSTIQFGLTEIDFKNKIAKLSAEALQILNFGLVRFKAFF